MKKFLALVLVVAMLGLAGAAMAADSDTGGHGSPSPVVNPEGRGSSSTPTIIPVLVSRIARNVLVIGRSFANMPTFSNATNVTGSDYTYAELTRSNALADLAEILGVPLGSMDTLYPMRSGDNLVEATTSNYVSSDVAGNLQRAAAILKSKSGADTLRAVGLLVPFSAKADGIQAFLLDAFPAALAGYRLGLDMNETRNAATASSAEFSASNSTGGSDAIAFIRQSDGLRIDTIPSNDRVIALATVFADTVYAPIVTAFVSTESRDAFNNATGTTTVNEVSVSVLEYAKATTGFSTAVDDNVKGVLEAAAGVSLDYIPNSAVGNSDWTATTTSYMTANNLLEVVHLPPLTSLDNNATGHSYVAKVFFKSGLNLNYDNVTSPDFYPNDVVEDGRRASKLYKVSGTTPTQITTANVKTQIAANGVAYLVFTVANNAVTATDVEAAAANLTKPSVVVSAWNNDGDPNPKGVGKASGGCAAGSAVLALAVLGSFIITRKK